MSEAGSAKKYTLQEALDILQDKNVISYKIYDMKTYSEFKCIEEVISVKFENPPAYLKTMIGAKGNLWIYNDLQTDEHQLFFVQGDQKIKLVLDDDWTIVFNAVLDYIETQSIEIEDIGIPKVCIKCGEKLTTVYFEKGSQYPRSGCHSEDPHFRCYRCD